MTNKLRNIIKINILWKDRFESAAKSYFPRSYQKIIDFVYDLLLLQQVSGKYGFKYCKALPVVEVSNNLIYKIFKSKLTVVKLSRFLVDNNFIVKDNSWIAKNIAYNQKKIHANLWHITAADYNPFDKITSLKLARRPIVEDAINSLLSFNSQDGVEHGMVYGEKVVDLYNQGELTVSDLLASAFYANKFVENIKKGKDSYTIDNREYSAIAACPKKIRSILFGLEEVYDIPAATLPTTLIAAHVDQTDTSNKELIKKALNREIDAYEEVYKNTTSWKEHYDWSNKTRKEIKGSFSTMVHCNKDQLQEFTTETYINFEKATKQEKYDHHLCWTNKEVVLSINETFPAFAKILGNIFDNTKPNQTGKEIFLYHTKGEKYFMDQVFQTIASKGIDINYAKLNVIRVHDAIWIKTGDSTIKQTVLDSIKETIDNFQ